MHGHCIYDFERAEKVRDYYRLPGVTHIKASEHFKISRALVGRIVTYKKYAKPEGIE